MTCGRWSRAPRRSSAASTASSTTRASAARSDRSPRRRSRSGTSPSTVLVRGVFLGMKHAAPLLRRQGAAASSTRRASQAWSRGYSPHAYASAKAAVIQLSKSVALELRPTAVRVNAICPGFIATPLALDTVNRTASAAKRGRTRQHGRGRNRSRAPASRGHRADGALPRQRRLELRHRPGVLRRRRLRRGPQVGRAAGDVPEVPALPDLPAELLRPCSARSGAARRPGSRRWPCAGPRRCPRSRTSCGRQSCA